MSEISSLSKRGQLSTVSKLTEVPITEGLILYLDSSDEASYDGGPTTNYFVPTEGSFPVNGTGTFQRLRSGSYGGYTIKPTDVVYRYEGSIDRLMGDGMMVIFGAPVVHENDPQRAILSALDMQTELKKLNDKLQEQNITIQMRIGINTGTVVVDNIGSDLRMEYTAMGDIVNMACE